MRTLIDIEENHIAELDQLAAKRKASRAALVREAVAEYLDRNAPKSMDAAFGLWRDREEDGLAYQERLREEW